MASRFVGFITRLPMPPTQLTDLVRQLGLQADVVSPRGRQLTEKVFGQALTPAQVVERICRDVRTKGLRPCCITPNSSIRRS